MDGVKANRSGHIFEKCVERGFELLGFEVVAYSKWVDAPERYGKDLLITNYPYTDITGSRCRMEYMIISATYNLKTRLEVKFQSAAGSVDEKLPKLYLDCMSLRANYDDSLIIIDGGGQRTKFIEWLKSAALTKPYTDTTNKHKNITVLGFVDFIKWLSDLKPVSEQSNIPLTINNQARVSFYKDITN